MPTTSMIFLTFGAAWLFVLINNSLIETSVYGQGFMVAHWMPYIGKKVAF